MGWSLLTGQGPDDCDYLGAREAWVFEHERLYYMADRIPMGRCGTKDEIAAMAEFIVSPENSFVTAFAFDLTGGRATY